MNHLEEQSVGRQLANHRDRNNQTGSAVVPLLQHRLAQTENRFWSTNRITNVEKNQAKPPDREVLQAFAEIYRLTPREYTHLLRATDYLPTDEEVREFRLNFRPILSEFSVPSYVINYRYELVLWNETFEQLYGAVSSPTFSSQSQVSLSSERVSQERSPITGIVPEEGQVTTSHPEVASLASLASADTLSTEDFLLLRAGLPFFLLLCSPRSRFRQQLAFDEWERFVDFLLVGAGIALNHRWPSPTSAHRRVLFWTRPLWYRRRCRISVGSVGQIAQQARLLRLLCVRRFCHRISPHGGWRCLAPPYSPAMYQGQKR